MSETTEQGLDTHVHLSPGEATPFPYQLENHQLVPVADQLRIAKDLGLKGICVTDHDTIVRIDEALNEGEKLGLIVTPGIELTALLLGHARMPHVIGLGITPERILTSKSKTDRELPRFKHPREVVAWIRGHGGIAIIPHSPGKDLSDARVSMPLKEVKKLARKGVLTGLETRGLYVRRWPDEDPEILQITRDYDLAPMAGSDAHGARRLGVARTEIIGDQPEKWQDVIEALRQGRTRTAVGVTYYNGEKIREFPGLGKERATKSTFEELDP